MGRTITGKCSRKQFLSRRGKEDYACTWVYKNKKESSGENYGICVNMYPFSKQPEEAFI